jgi:hypothetical protein
VCNQQKVDNPIKTQSANDGSILKLTHGGEIYNFFATTCLTGTFMLLIPGLAPMSLLAMGPLYSVMPDV